MAVGTGQNLLAPTARIVSASLSNHRCDAAGLPALVDTVRRGLGEAAAPQEAMQAARPEPAVPIRRFMFPDHIVCLEDGRRLETLKRHLARACGLTLDSYRRRWGLPATYPMAAPDYVSARSSLARRIGLGQCPRGDAPGWNEPASGSAGGPAFVGSGIGVASAQQGPCRDWTIPVLIGYAASDGRCW